jgi:hypothetical protein
MQFSFRFYRWITCSVPQCTGERLPVLPGLIYSIGMALPGDTALKTRIGKRAGVASGLLGMLCIFGELCFLLPDLLVKADARLP